MEFATTFTALMQTGALLCMFAYRRQTRERKAKMFNALSTWIEISKDQSR